MSEVKAARQQPLKADGLMPDQIRIPHRIPDMDDTPDWDLTAHDVLPYTQQQVGDACHRAVAWRARVAKSQGAADALCASITSRSNLDDMSRPDGMDWMRVGWVDDPWIGGKLCIFWHPGTNRVQVDRPPQPRRMLIASSAPDPRPTITVTATINVRGDSLVTMQVRPLRSPEPIITLVVPAPRGQPYWVWSMRTAAAKTHELHLPTTFSSMDARGRRELLVQQAYVLASRIACGSEENVNV